MTVKTFNPDNCSLVLLWRTPDNQIGSKDVEDWDEARFAYTDARAEFSTSTTGQITRSLIKNKLGTASVDFPQGSDALSLISNVMKSVPATKWVVRFIEKQPIGGVPLIDLEDVVTGEFTLGSATVSDAGEASRGRAASVKTVVFTGELLDNFDGQYV